MAYAIIRTGGKQYRVEPGDVLRLERLPGEVGAEIAFEEVLLRSDEGGVALGSPLVEGARVAARIVAQGKARKILVFKKKRRKKYRRHHGHRQLQTTVEVLSIG